MSNSLYEKYPEYFFGKIVSAEEFLDLQIISKETYPENVQKKITIRELEDLKKSTCISLNGGDGLVCITEDGDIESVLKKNGATLEGFLNIAFVNAISRGGNKLDCYNCAGATPGKGTTLGDNYCKRGFIPVCRIRFNRLMVDKEMAKTYGEPEVIFFIYCGDAIEEYIGKLKNKEYPGLSEFKYIPYIDEIQDDLGMNSDDTDYCFALKYRNIINEKWMNGYKEKFKEDFNEFITFTRSNKEEVLGWIRDDENSYENIEYPEISIMNALSSQIDEEGDYLYKDGIHMLLDLLGDESVEKLKKEPICDSEYSFYLCNSYHFDLDAPRGLWNKYVLENNAYRIEDKDYFMDFSSEKNKAILYVSPSDNEEIRNEVYIFNNEKLAEIDWDGMPFLVYKDELLWFIDKDENNEDKIHSYNPKTDELKVYSHKIVEDVFATFPIHLKNDEFIYFYQKEEDCISEYDFTAIKVKTGENEPELLRIGEIVGINDRYIYSRYGGLEYYRTDMESFTKKSLEMLGLCEFNVNVAYIDAARDIVYSKIEDMDIDMYTFSEEELARMEEMFNNSNYDTFTRGVSVISPTMNESDMFAMTNESLLLDNFPMPADMSFEAKHYREFGDDDLIGINKQGIPVKIWAVPDEKPSLEKYGCIFTGDGFEYFEWPDGLY